MHQSPLPFPGGEDYTPSAGSLVFSPADTSTGVQVVIRDDSVVEYQERFIVALSVPDTETGVVLAQPRRVVVTISNDDCEQIIFTSAPALMMLYIAHCKLYSKNLNHLQHYCQTYINFAMSIYSLLLLQLLK